VFSICKNSDPYYYSLTTQPSKQLGFEAKLNFNPLVVELKQKISLQRMFSPHVPMKIPESSS